MTGGAGFIGSNLIKRLLTETKGTTIINIDNLNTYYDVSLKEHRLKELERLSQASSPGSLSPTVSPSGVTYRFLKADIADKPFIDKLFAEYKPQIVVNLAAQAGVRYYI